MLLSSGLHQLHEVNDGTHAWCRGGARGDRLRSGVEAWGDTAYQELGKPSSGRRLRPQLLPGREGRSFFRGRFRLESSSTSWFVCWLAGLSYVCAGLCCALMCCVVLRCAVLCFFVLLCCATLMLRCALLGYTAIVHAVLRLCCAVLWCIVPRYADCLFCAALR